MKVLGNIIWLVFGGIIISVEYFISSIFLILTVVGIPFAMQTIKLGLLALWPFGRSTIISEQPTGCVSTLMNLIWLLFGGIWIACSHAILGLLFFITIIGIPFGQQHFKLATVAISPFGREIVSA